MFEGWNGQVQCFQMASCAGLAQVHFPVGGETVTLDIAYHGKNLPQGLTDRFDTLDRNRGWLPLSIAWGGPGMIVTTLREDAKAQLNTALPGEKVIFE